MILDPIVTTAVDSSNIARIGYDFKGATLAVVFRQHGIIWHYHPIPRPLFMRLARSDSKGAFFARWIRDNAAVTSLLWCDCGRFVHDGEHLDTCVAITRELKECLKASNSRPISRDK